MEGTKIPDIKNEATKRPNGAYGFPFRGYRVIVHNLEQSVTWRDLKDFLRMAGEVRFADVIVPGTGIGEFGTPQERASVVRRLNGKELKGNKVLIKHLNELDPRYQSRPIGRYHHEGTGFHHPPCDPPFNPGFEPYFNGGPTGPPMDYPPFGPPPPRMPWGVNRGGRMYPPFMPPYPPAAPFGRGMVRPDVNNWMPPAPPRPPPPVRTFERPQMVYSQPPPPIRAPEYAEHHEEPTYPRAVPSFPEAPIYESRPETAEYRAYRYQEVREKDYAEDWSYRREADGVYGYDPPPSADKTMYPREDSRGEYPDYVPSHSTSEDRRKEYVRSGYGYVEDPYPKTTEPIGYVKSRGDDYKFRLEDYSRDGYPSGDVYPKEHHREYEYSRSEARSYEYKSREPGYYDRRDHDRGYRDDDPRGAGGMERSRQRSHRLGPYDR